MIDACPMPSPGRPQLRLVSTSDDAPAASAEASLADTYKRYAPYVARIVIRMLPHRSELEDIVQDVFVEAVRGLRGLRDPAAIKGWLGAVTMRVVRRRLRVRKLRQWLRMDEADYASIEAVGASPEDRALLACVYRVLDGVPIDARNAWLLRHIEGEALESVAVLCGCSLATAKRRITQAARALEEALGDG